MVCLEIQFVNTRNGKGKTSRKVQNQFRNFSEIHTSVFQRFLHFMMLNIQVIENVRLSEQMKVDWNEQ